MRGRGFGAQGKNRRRFFCVMVVLGALVMWTLWHMMKLSRVVDGGPHQEKPNKFTPGELEKMQAGLEKMKAGLRQNEEAQEALVKQALLDKKERLKHDEDDVQGRAERERAEGADLERRAREQDEANEERRRRREEDPQQGVEGGNDNENHPKMDREALMARRHKENEQQPGEEENHDHEGNPEEDEGVLGKKSGLSYSKASWSYGAELLPTQRPAQDPPPRAHPIRNQFGPDACQMPYGLGSASLKGKVFPLPSTPVGKAKAGDDPEGKEFAEAEHDIFNQLKEKERGLRDFMKMRAPIILGISSDPNQVEPGRLEETKSCLEEILRILQWEYGLQPGESIYYEDEAASVLNINDDLKISEALRQREDRNAVDGGDPMARREAEAMKQGTRIIFSVGPDDRRDIDKMQEAEMGEEAQEDILGQNSEAHGLSVGVDGLNEIHVVSRTQTGVFRAMTSLKYLMDPTYRYCPDTLRDALLGGAADQNGEEVGNRGGADHNAAEEEEGRDEANPLRDNDHNPNEERKEHIREERQRSADNNYINLHTYPLTFDWPQTSWRGLMVDSARHFISLESLKSLIQQLAMLKMNVLHLHLSDDQGWRLVLDQFPNLAQIGGRRGPNLNPKKPGDEGGGPIGVIEPGDDAGRYYGSLEYDSPQAYSRDELMELSDFATAYHVSIVPEIDLPAHTGAIIASIGRDQHAAGPGVYKPQGPVQDGDENNNKPGEDEGADSAEILVEDGAREPGDHAVDGVLRIGEGCDAQYKKLEPEQKKSGAINCMGGTHGLLYPTDTTMSTLDALLTQIVQDVFPDSHYVHIGGDEAADLRDNVWGHQLGVEEKEKDEFNQKHPKKKKQKKIDDIAARFEEPFDQEDAHEQPKAESAPVGPMRNALNRFKLAAHDDTKVLMRTVQDRMVEELRGYVTQQGRSTVVWGESFTDSMAETSIAEGPDSPVSAVSMWWRDWHPDASWEKVKQRFKNQPHNLVLAPASKTYLDYYQLEPHKENKFAVQAGTVTVADALSLGDQVDELNAIIRKLKEVAKAKKEMKDNAAAEGRPEQDPKEAEEERKLRLEEQQARNKAIKGHGGDPNELMEGGYNEAEQKTPIIGVEACLWTETITSWEIAQYQLFPRLMAIASTAWRGGAPPKSSSGGKNKDKKFTSFVCEQVKDLNDIYSRVGMGVAKMKC